MDENCYNILMERTIMTNKQKLIEDLTPLLKERGYRKQKQTWYRQGTDLVIVFNIQNSPMMKKDSISISE